MTAIRVFVARVMGLFRRRDAELDQDIQTHLDFLTDENIRHGMDPQRARVAARRTFGGVTQTKEAYRDARGLRWIDGISQDIRYATRMVCRSPGFSLITVTTLTLGIAGSSAIFSLANALSFKPLPVDKPDELTVFTVVGGDESFSYPMYQQFRDEGTAFSGIGATGALAPLRMTVGKARDAATEIVLPQPVSGNLFAVLGVGAQLGRGLSPEDDGPAAQPVVVISHRLWTRRFGEDPAILGETVFLNDAPFTIVGVMPSSFRGIDIARRPDVWWPLSAFPQVYGGGERLTSRGEWLRLIGRVRAGVSRAHAQHEVDAIFQRDLAETFKARVTSQGQAFTDADRQLFLNRGIRLLPGRGGWSGLRRQFERPLRVLLLLVGTVLLIACSNVASLVAARSVVREREIAMRLALGATPLRVIRQLATEVLVLALVAGALGLLASVWGGRLLLKYLPDSRLTLDTNPDVRVFAFTLGISILAGLVVSVLAGVRVITTDRTAGLTPRLGGARLSTAPGTHALIVVQFGLACVLVCGADLFGRTLRNLQELELGFVPQNLTIFDLDVPAAYDRESRTHLYARVLERLEQIPQVQSATYSLFGFLSGSNWGQRVSIAGYTPGPNENMTARATIIGPRFFETMGTPIVHGRSFNQSEGPGRQREAIISQAMQERFFGRADPIGRSFTFSGWDGPFQIVGVASNTRYRSLREAVPPVFYVPFVQTPAPTAAARIGDFSMMRFEVLSTASAGSLANTLSRAVRDVDPRVAVLDVQAMGDVVDNTLAQERLLSGVTQTSTIFAVLLAAIGLYGTRAYAVAQRTKEIGIRMALGAERRRVIRLVMSEAFTVVAVGLVVGLIVAGVASRTIESMLFGVTPGDPRTYVTAVLVLASAALLAAYLPARRAARVDPMVALRSE